MKTTDPYIGVHEDRNTPVTSIHDAASDESHSKSKAP